ncbi:MAG: thiamine phosphate synthase [Clostridiales bacterium]|nr:thiamine phosphate synthase [Clostridiales bacterium]
MKLDNSTMRLYAVTDSAWIGRQTLYEQVECALRGGVTCVQLREKHKNTAELLDEAIKLRELCGSYNVPFIINDNVELALKSGADGVHVGQDDMNVAELRKLVGDNFIIGASAHNVNEAIQAERDGADYLGVGAVFATSTKSDASPLSFDTLRAITDIVSIPVVAIGGINRERILKLTGSGVDGVALVSAIFSAEDIESECRKLRELSNRMVTGNA